LWVVRSFSPAFGLGGLRLGYLLGHRRAMKKITTEIGDSLVSMPAQIAGTAALKATDEMHEYVAAVKENMARVHEVLASMKLSVVSTPANYILIKVAQPAATAEYLASKLIFVHNCAAHPGLEGYLRITIGDHPTTARLLTSFLRIPRAFLGPGIDNRRMTLRRPSEHPAQEE
jgi:histidinol-phosphate aminotransferase